MDGEVKSHELNELGIIESDHVAVVGGPVKTGVSGGKVAVLAVEIVEDLAGDGGKVGDAVHAIFVDIFPVGGLVDTLGVSLEIIKIRNSFEPRLVTLANLDWEFMRVTAAENWAIG